MKKNSGGFTLIELLVVLVILGLLAGLILPKMMGRTEDARRQTAEIQIRSIENALAPDFDGLRVKSQCLSGF